MMSVLVVDDDLTTRQTLAEFLATLGFAARMAATASEGRQAAAAHAPDVAFIDLRLPDESGLTLLQALRNDDPELGIIMLTGHADVQTAFRAMQQGALDFLEKPVDLDSLGTAVARAAELVRLRREVRWSRARPYHSSGPVDAGGVSPSLERLVELAARNDDLPVLIHGEPGTGKRRVAWHIHARSARSSQPFIAVNVASLDAATLERELFGHERLAFGDDTPAGRGLLEVAGPGTLFLDELGEVALEIQPKLLAVLETQSYCRLGGAMALRSNARILAATSCDMADLVANGRFRADLFTRFQVLTLVLPALRDRRDELEAVVHALLPRGAHLSSSAMNAVQRYGWPGNLRELENTLWRAAVLADGSTIEAKHLALPALEQEPAAPLTLLDTEQRAIREALRATHGNKLKAAARLGIARSTLLEKLKRLDG